jgi:hypothetical protein
MAMASVEGELPIPAIPAFEVSSEELTKLFTDARRSYWMSFVQHQLFLRDNPHVEESESQFLEPMALSKLEMTRRAHELTERGEAVPSRSCSVVSLFLHDEPDVGSDNAPVSEPVSLEVLEAAIPLHASLEASWHQIDAAYLVAWVEQHLFLLENPHASDEEVSNTPFTAQMILQGRALEAVENRLLPLGWRRPSTRLVHDLFPRLALDL